MAVTTTTFALRRATSAIHPIVLATLMLIAAMRAASADQFLEGDAACDALSECTITNIDPVTTPIGSERLVIMIRDMMHIEVFDSDGFSVFVQYGVGNPTAAPITVQFDYAFIDMDGSPVGPVLFGSEVDIPAMGGTGNPNFAPAAPDGGTFILHGLEIEMNCEACGEMTPLTLANIQMIELTDIDDTSRVGVWVPEPSTVALVALGGASMSLRRRSRSRG